MLETIREFALERLDESGERAELARRHAEHYFDLAIESEPHLIAEDQREWLDRCEAEHPNIRAALSWALENAAAERAQRAAGALWRFWQQRGHLAEGRGWMDGLLRADDSRTAARAHALIGAGGLAWWQQDRDAAGRFYREAVEIERTLGDPRGLAEALYNLSFVVAGDDLEAATRLLEESLALSREAGNEHGVAQVLSLLVMRDAEAGRWDQVVQSLEEGIGIWRGLGDRLHLAFDLVWLGFAYGRAGRNAAARAAAVEALELFHDAENGTGVGIALIDLAFISVWDGRHEDALVFAGASDAVRLRVGGPPGAIGGLLEGDPAAEARQHLTDEVARRAWDRGAAMTVDQAVGLARELSGSAERAR
jgi:tetratricopeptide (TPR) repeat protein